MQDGSETASHDGTLVVSPEQRVGGGEPGVPVRVDNNQLTGNADVTLFRVRSDTNVTAEKGSNVTNSGNTFCNII